jgi:signal transduction histidine kinase/CheY-like chemotaxis protein
MANDRQIKHVTDGAHPEPTPAGGKPPSHSRSLRPRNSLRWRLPLFFGVLVLLMLGAYLWATTRTVNTTLSSAAANRAKAGAEEIADRLSQAMERVLEQGERYRRHPDLHSYLRDQSAANRAAAVAALTPATPPRLRRVELWDAHGALVLELATTRDTATGLRAYPRGAPPAGEGISDLQASGGYAYFDVVTAIRDDSTPDSVLLGYLRRYGEITSSAIPIRRVLGDESAVKIGTVGNSVWTDFYSVVEAPPHETDPAAAETRAGSDRRWIGSSAPIESSPWVVWVGYPRAVILAPAQPFKRRMAWLALLFVALGVTSAGVLGVRLTQPLHALARAAERISAGDYTQRVEIRRDDEIGRLSTAFNTMAGRIEHVRRLESQLLQAQKMEAVGQLAGGVAHDFNNMLTAIIGHAELVLADAEESPLRDDVNEILKAAQSAAVLTHQLLIFSRRQVVQQQVLNLNSVIADAEKLLRRLIGDDITFVTELEPDLENVTGDPGQFQQVLVNLAINARDAMPDGGTLRIASANVDLTEAYTSTHATVEPGRYVILTVSDTGTGMDAETQERLFEPFFTTKPAGKGSGLGLATVYGIVKQSGGHIYVYTEPGHGTTFRIYLPGTAAMTTTGERRIPAPRPVGGTETILIVDDNDAVRSVAKAILERLGYRTVVAVSGEDALRIVDETHLQPDLVITDVIMPGISGPELGRQLAERNPAVRLLFTSGYSGDAIGRHGLDAPGTLFIEKPYTPGGLAGKVREALGQRG